MITPAIESVVPREQIKQNNETHHPLGNSGMHIIEACSEEDISNVLAYANDHDKTVNVISGGTKQGYGGTMKQADILLSLAGYKGIVEHSVGDLTLTVRPGTTLKEISDQLAEKGQCIALDPSWPELATIGGIVAANDSGAKRLLYGSARDLVIGTRIVYPDGRVIRMGGKVVKNVAGYDMNKLFIGAMGTLGVMSEITLKLRPLPKYEALSLLHFPEGDEKKIHDVAKRMLDSMMEPVSLEVLTPSTAEKLTGKKLHTLAIAFEDQENAVRVQEKWVTEHLPAGARQTVLFEDEARKWWGQFRQLGPNGYNDSVHSLGLNGYKGGMYDTDPNASTENLSLNDSNNTTDDLYPDGYNNESTAASIQATVKIGSQPSDVLGILQKAEQLAVVHHISIDAHGGAGHGISRVYVYGRADDVIAYMKALRSEAENRHGYAVGTHLPFNLRKIFDVWGDKPAYFALLEGIKQTNDPKKILNRHRFVGGI
ncbi:FAD/FMN-containing dehydrogenase [Lentibacillus halodurans]|uniref:FAD/FMN-containing dehydrogenase n=1 Tax=Lentibacillus halodurans TaxID=237679 RepID=A0A1I0XEX6_9BACI|nr:FAD-binding oxidoreductase [Lentibacillus halodurans]SFA99572.1 FAD/FMN-containing dehydrogenase [Lentibacillus halodurans]